MATTASSASSSASRYSIDSSPWMPDAIHDHPSPPVSLHDPFFPSVSPPPAIDSSDLDNADKKPVWNKPSNSSAQVRPVMGAESWPALSLSAKPSSSSNNKKSPPSFDSSSMPMPMPMPQAAGTPLNSTSSSNLNANANAHAGSTAAPSSHTHTLNGQRKPFRRNNNNTSSSTTNISNPPTAAAATPSNTRDHYHNQRSASNYGSGTTHFRNSQRNRNTSSYPRGDALHHGNKRNYEHANHSGFPHRNYHGRDMHLQPQRGLGIMRPHMLMGPPSFPATSAQYMPIASHGGGPMLYPDYSPHVFMPHPPPEPMPLVGHLPPLQIADNLSRDEHLRGQMSDEGWVPVRVIAGFRRLSELTNNMQTILEALRSSAVVEIKGETLRRRGDWDKYLLPREPSKSGPLGSQLERMTLSERSREGE